MAVPVFDPDAPSEEVAVPRFDPSKPFEEVAAPRFDESKPFEEISPTVAAMADATRHTVGVVGRAIAVAASDRSANVPPEGVTVWERGEQKWYPSQEAADTAFKTHMNAAQARAAEFENPLLTLPRIDMGILGPSQANVPGAVKVAAGAFNAAMALPEFFTTPVGVSLLASGNLPAIAQRLIAGGFAVDMALHTPEQIMALAKAVQSGDKQAIGETATSLGINVALTGLTGRHALKTPLETVAPLTAEAVAKVEPNVTKVAEGLIATEPIKLWSSSTVEPGKAIYLSSRKADAEAYSLGRPVEQYQPTVRKTFDPETSTDADLVRLFDAEGGLYEAPQKQSFRDALSAKGYDSIKGGEVGAGGPSEWLIVFDPANIKAQSPTPLTTEAVAKVVEKEPVPPPAPTPAAATSELSKPAPVPAGVEPPAKPSVTPEVTSAKPGPLPDNHEVVYRGANVANAPASIEGALGPGFYVTNDPAYAAAHGKHTQKFTIDKSQLVSWHEMPSEAHTDAFREWVSQKKSEGYKGINGVDEYVIWDESALRPVSAKPEGERTLTTEPVAKVQAEVSKVANEEGQRSAKDIKAELIDEIQEKLTKAPSEAVVGETVTIEIPGDGKFTVPNTVEALSGMLARAKKLKTDAGKPPGVPRSAVKSSANAIEQTTSIPKWTAATKAGVELGTQTLAGIPDPIATVKAVIALAKEASPYIKRAGEAVARAARSAREGAGEFVGEQMKAQRMTDYRRGVLNWSSKLQQSFGEADSAQKEIRKSVPDAVRREGITNWIQAGGDADVLRARANATADPKLKAGYEAALSLTPEEIAVANDVRVAFEELGQRGETYDVLNSFKENYVTQTWDLGRGPASGGSRTLKEKFRFSKASTFPTYFDGEQAGYVPKTKDISKLLPMYLHEMNSVIAARQLVQEMARGVGSDGRPLVAARGGGVPVEGDGGRATLIMPKKVAKDTGDYKVLENQPALTGWRWASKDTDGNPIFLKADLALHPEAYKELKKVLGQSAIKEWYQSRTSATAQIPKLIVKAIDVAQNETKRTMLGFFAPFHQVQEGTHAVGHRINPFFGIPKIDLVGNKTQVDATRHGLMLLPDRISAEQFMEGFRHSGLISMIPKIGPAADWYSHYLFQEYIPGLKFKTYEHILTRNSKVYEKELASGELKAEDVKVLSAEQANAAYGHLNYADLARNPTIMHAMRLGLLAPDFLEARARFAGQALKGIAGAKVGREQVLALATLAVAQTATAWIAAQTTGGSWDAKHPFEMVNGDRRYSMRSVPEDIAGLIADSRKFFYSRLSPLVGKGIIQGVSGVDYKGDKMTAGDTAKELAQAPIPLPLRGFLGTSHRNLTAFEELAGSVGLRISRYLPEDVSHAIQLRDEVDLWINRSKKLDTDEERATYLTKQLTDLSPEDRKKAVTRIKQRTAPGVRRRVR